MNKKLSLSIIISILLILASFVVISAKNDKFSKYLKFIGVLRAKDGVIYSVPSNQDKNKFIKNLDSMTMNSTEKIESKASKLVDKELKEEDKVNKKIKFNYEGVEHEISVNYVIKDNKKILLPSYDKENYEIKEFKNNNFLLEFDSDLFYLDIESSSVKPALKDKIFDYDKNELKQKAKETDNLLLNWARNGFVNKKKDKIIYFSNRNVVKNNKGNGEIWLVDLETGDDTSLGEIGYEFLGWDNDDNAYYLTFDRNVAKVNTLTYDVEIIANNVGVETKMMFPYLLNGNNGLIDILNLETGSKEIFGEKYKNLDSISNIDKITNIQVNLFNNQYIAFRNRPDRTKAYSNIGVLNINTLEYLTFEAPEDTKIESFSWFDSNNMFVTITDKTMSQSTYIVCIDDLKEDKK